MVFGLVYDLKITKNVLLYLHKFILDYKFILRLYDFYLLDIVINLCELIIWLVGARLKCRRCRCSPHLVMLSTLFVRQLFCENKMLITNYVSNKKKQ